MDKQEAVVEFLLTCPYIQSSPLFYNFGKEESDNKQLITHANDVKLNVPFIDGSVRKRFTFTIIDYKAVAYRAIPTRSGATDENLDSELEVQQLIEWVDEQEEARNYPNFGNDCVVEELRAVTEQPNLNSVNRSVTPALAKYSVSITIDYIDYSKAIWK